MANWDFHEPRNLIVYKAALAGVAVVFVDPRNTSRGCSCCGLTDKRNRPSRDKFRCIGCGIAARPITMRHAISDNGAFVARSLVMALQGTRSTLSPEESRPRWPTVHYESFALLRESISLSRPCDRVRSKKRVCSICLLRAADVK